MENCENPNVCVCGGWKREAVSFCFECTKRIAEIRERKIQQQTDRVNVSRYEGSPWDVPRIVERAVPVPQAAYCRTNRWAYDSEDGKLDDIVRLYEDCQ
jgi:hypothetical protein